MLDEVFAVAALDPHLERAGMVGGGLLEEGAARGETWTPAAVTSTASSRPRVSVMMLRLRPTTLLPASMPWLVAGTLVEVFTFCVSITQAEGCLSCSSRWRTNVVSSRLSWAKMPSFCHLAK
ncbi:hypothetical protein SALBM135S_07223 [Streptomyces alboniger]